MTKTSHLIDKLKSDNSTSAYLSGPPCIYVPVLTRNWLVSPGWSTSCREHAKIVAKTSRSLNTFWNDTQATVPIIQTHNFYSPVTGSMYRYVNTLKNSTK